MRYRVRYQAVDSYVSKLLVNNETLLQELSVKRQSSKMGRIELLRYYKIPAQSLMCVKSLIGAHSQRQS